MKKIVCMLVLVCSLIVSAFTLVGCGGAEPVKPAVNLVNWEDETVEVTLHSDVEISTDAVYDDAGKAYAVVAKVKTKGGEDVPVIGGKFIADYAGGYEIIYSLHDESVTAPSRTVTVNIKNSDTPVPYFMKSNIVVYENTPFDVPAHGVSIAPEINFTQELGLYKIGDEDSRVKVDADLSGKLTLPVGSYVFVLSAAAGEKTGAAELGFRVRMLDELNAVSTLDSASEINLGTSFWNNAIGGWDARNIDFSAEAKRNGRVSHGAAVVTLPKEATEAYFSVRPDISRAKFKELMAKEGARISMWIKIESENKQPHTIVYGDHANRKTVTASDGEWLNILMKLDDFGVENADTLYDKLLASSGNHTNSPFAVRHADAGSYTVTVDSIYVALPLSATMADKTVEYGVTDTVTATSEETDEFTYTLYDIAAADDTPTESADGKFTFDVAGKLEITASPVRNRFYLPEPLSATVTVTGAENMAFAETAYELEPGLRDLPQVSFSGEVSHRLETTDGSVNYSYLPGFNVPDGMSIDAGKIRLFEGEYKLYAYGEKDSVKYSAFTRISVTNDDTVSDGDLALFDNPSDMSAVYANDRGFYSYVGDYQGASGVVKFSAGAAGLWPQMRLDKVLHTAEELADQGFDGDDYIAMRVYGENLPYGYYSYFTQAYGVGQNTEVAVLKQGAWQTLYVKASMFFDYEANWSAGDNRQFAGFCFTNNGENSAEIYVDSIKLVKNNGASSVDMSGVTVEYNNFAGETDSANVAYNNCANGNFGIALTYEGAANGKTGVINATNHVAAQWPVFAIPARATKAAYVEKMGNGTAWKFKMDVLARANHGGSTIGFQGAGYKSADLPINGEWTTVEFPADKIFAALNDDGTMKKGCYFVLAAAGNSVKYDVLIANMRFEMGGITTDLSDGGVLKVPAGATVKVGTKTLAKTATEGTEDSYNLAAEVDTAAWGSQSVTATVSMTGLDDVSVTWSSPAAANEINGFGSGAATDAFTANRHPDCAVSVIAEHNGRKGVAQIECRKTEQDPGWANFRYGAPLLTAEQSAVYTGNPCAYIAIDIAANKSVVVDFRVDDIIKGKIAVTTEWQTWLLPAYLFDAAKFASGDIFSNVETQYGKPIIYIDSIKFVTVPIEKNETRYDIIPITAESKYDFNNGYSYFEYVENQTLGDRNNVDALKFEAYGAWPTFGAILAPSATDTEYTAWFGDGLNTGKFVMQVYVQNSYTNNMGIQSINGDNIEYRLEQGWNTVTIDANRVLSKLNTIKFVPCNTNGVEYNHVLYITDMYFEKTV